jgi:hypothetical protein
MLIGDIDDNSHDAESRRLRRLQAMRYMFEDDLGRPPVTMEELRDWMGIQHLDQLQIRMKLFTRQDTRI